MELEKILSEGEKTGKTRYAGYALYHTRTGWQTYPGYDNARFAKLTDAIDAVDRWRQP